MTTKTDAQFASRFSGIVPATYVANQTNLADFEPTVSVLNTGMMSDIGRVTLYEPESQDSFWDKFMKSPLERGDSNMTARFKGINSYEYDPNADQDKLFDVPKPEMVSNIATKNLSRQIAVEINDRYLKQMAQTKEMIGDAQACIMGASMACYYNDMWVASKEYFSGSTRSMGTNQYTIMTNGVDDPGFGAEMTELMFKYSQNKFGYISTLYNVSGIETKSPTVTMALKKDCEFPAFKKLLSETFNPELLRVNIDGGINYVDDFATPAGAPVDAGELIGIIVDPRCYEITPMPEALITESFRNPARHSTAYFTTYEYALQDNPFFNKAFIYAPKPATP